MMIRQDIRARLMHGFYVLFLLFLMHRLFFPSFGMAEHCMSYFLYPFFKIHATVSTSLQQKEFHKQTEDQLREQLQILSMQYDVLQGRLIQLQAQQQFLQQTADLRSFTQKYESKQVVIAKILMTVCSDQEDIVFIEGGKNKYFTKDDVVVYQNALVGRIIEVYPWYSKIVLISDQRCRIAAEISEGISGICCGANNKTLKLSFVPHFKPVKVGDMVFSTGQGLLYPSGFALGVVQTVQTDLVSHTIQVKPMFDIAKLSYVYVLIKN